VAVPGMGMIVGMTVVVMVVIVRHDFVIAQRNLDTITAR